ncbi:hypothetical protein GSI_04165 [Ganoderma sinense ZZ0214-1]|uniref:EthD domain-containing protein n=1 Tax=Ganoderma sinense ZZ0214-1 TaxID=1077348 RepID=A0A2G8SIF5_9APHY|nr:hypothetical protein GSI_04165 [Ganoderma sinense ZZ0214-1]
MSQLGLLFVFGEPGPNLADAEFNDWYDNEHVPLRMAIPTFPRTTRWAAVDGQRPTYLATYDLTSCEILEQPPYNALAQTRSLREKDVLARAELLDRRTYDLLEPDIVPAAEGYNAGEPGPYFITLQARVRPEIEDDLNRWYHEEHIPLLAKVPGWRRSRRYVLRDVGPASGTGAGELEAKGRPPKYLAVHEWESLASFETEEFRHATSTPWRMRLFEGAEVWDRRLFNVMRTWVQE